MYLLYLCTYTVLQCTSAVTLMQRLDRLAARHPTLQLLLLQPNGLVNLTGVVPEDSSPSDLEGIFVFALRTLPP